MLFNLATVKSAFDNAAEGRHYLTQDDIEIFFVEIFGQRPSHRIMNHMCEEFDVSIGGRRIGVSLPKLIHFVKSELSCDLSGQEGPSEHELHALFQSLDARGSNFLCMKDFVSRANNKLLRGSLRMAFKQFDVDGDGRVSYRDFLDGIKAGNVLI